MASSLGFCALAKSSATFAFIGSFLAATMGPGNLVSPSSKIRKKRANGRNSEAADFLAFEGYRFSELQRDSLAFSRYENNLRLDLAGCPPRQ